MSRPEMILTGSAIMDNPELIPQFKKEIMCPTANYHSSGYLGLCIRADLDYAFIEKFFNYHFTYDDKEVISSKTYTSEEITFLLHSMVKSVRRYPFVESFIISESLKDYNSVKNITWKLIKDVTNTVFEYGEVPLNIQLYMVLLRYHLLSKDHLEQFMKHGVGNAHKQFYETITVDIYESSYYSDDEKEDFSDVVECAYSRNLLLGKIR